MKWHIYKPLGSQSEGDASYLDSHISDKQDSKALLLLAVITVVGCYYCCCDSVIAEGQSWRWKATHR